MKLIVDAAAGMLHADGRSIACSIGRRGVRAAEEKQEGDGATPLGRWRLRGILLRPDRIAPIRLALAWRWLRPDDGWSDDPRDPAYNRPVRHPHPFSAERLWREDELYDVIVVLGHNDSPPRPGRGSAIFLHCRRVADPTEGCVAIAREMLVALLPEMRPGDWLEIG